MPSKRVRPKLGVWTRSAEKAVNAPRGSASRSPPDLRNARSGALARRARREGCAERLGGVADEARAWTYRVSLHRERRANGRANLGEEEKWIKRQWAFEDVAGERHALRARADGRRGVSREARPAFRRAPRWNVRCVATNAASPDVPPRSSPAMSPRAGSRRRREPASAMLASRETWRGPGCAVGGRTGWRARTPFT